MEEKYEDRLEILKRAQNTDVGDRVPTNPSSRVSIVIPAYNLSELICETLDSVFAQTYNDFEVIVVNDGSIDTEKLEQKLTDYADQIIYVVQENSGAAKARNLAICIASGSLIAFLDGDDLWHPEYLKRQIHVLEEQDLDMVYCDAELFGEVASEGRTYMETTPSSGEVTPVSLIRAKCNVITSGTVVKKEKLEEFGLFDSDGNAFEDFDLWFRLSKNGVKIGYQKAVLLKYRMSSTSLSGSSVQRAERNVSVLNFIRNKYQITEEEEEALKIQIKFSAAEVDLEKGKLYLTQGEYEQAKKYLRRANEYYRKPKLTLMNYLLKVSPALALLLFKKIRAADFSFITSNTANE